MAVATVDSAPCSMAVSTVDATPCSMAVATTTDVMTGFARYVSGCGCLLNGVPRHFAVVLWSRCLCAIVRTVVFCSQVFVVTVNVLQSCCSGTVKGMQWM
jgi:hypothetical protein